MKPQRLLSEEMRAVAEALRDVRQRINQLVQDGSWPEGMFADMSTILVYGPIMTDALVRLSEATR
ncbi:MAG TPA: hypothetical protein VH575_25210 [Gemmataceae bacterium]|jgi:hypothetical protein